MPDARPSPTDRRVAAWRLGFERLAAPEAGGQGAADADDRLAADVAAGVTVDWPSPMGRYLRARTMFFDRVVVNALARHVAQIVVVGAGYDGRALRYATAGVRWWEVDRAVTQEAKRGRLARLGIAVGNVTFVSLDLPDGGLAAALASAGFEPDAPALYLAEGVASALGTPALRDLLHDLRSAATIGTRLAISLRPPDAGSVTRIELKAGPALLDEPGAGSVTAEDAKPLLAECRWQMVELSERSRAAGFVVAAPVFAPAGPGVPPTAGRIGAFAERMLYRRGGDTLAGHLAAAYGVPVTRLRELDLGVHRVERADGSTWVARVFPADRLLDAARDDAGLLTRLAQAGIPAERPAAAGEPARGRLAPPPARCPPRRRVNGGA